MSQLKIDQGMYIKPGRESYDAKRRRGSSTQRDKTYTIWCDSSSRSRNINTIWEQEAMDTYYDPPEEANKTKIGDVMEMEGRVWTKVTWNTWAAKPSEKSNSGGSGS